MLNNSVKIDILSELLTCINNLYFWKYSADFELIHTNCDDPGFFQAMFEINGYKEKIQSHFMDSDFPITLADSIGFVWLVAGEKTDGHLSKAYIIGPTMTNDFAEQNVIEKMGNMTLSISRKREIIKKIQAIPVIGYETFLNYGVMLHFCITQEKINISDIFLDQPQNSYSKVFVERWKKNEFHGTWHYEQTYVQLIEDGNLNYESILAEYGPVETVGKMCIDDPLRQTKNGVIIQVALTTRAAIKGGVSPETAYTLSDYYIQRIENYTTINEIYSLAKEMTHDFVSRVHNIKTKPTYSKLTLSCIDYVDNHLKDKLKVEQIASTLGYSKYYLTSIFKKDTNENLRDYINRKKIELSMTLLKTTNLSIQEISEMLYFANPSYYCSVFRNHTGMSPNAYRAGK